MFPVLQFLRDSLDSQHPFTVFPLCSEQLTAAFLGIQFYYINKFVEHRQKLLGGFKQLEDGIHGMC